jgi:alpha-L-arabinofuranosidase
VGRDLAWDRTVTERAGQHFAWVSQHDYFPSVWAKDFGPEEKLSQDIILHPVTLEESMKGVARLLDEVASKTGNRLVISLDEWNIWPANELIQPMIGGTASFPYDATLSAVVNDLQRDFALREGLHACGIFHMLYRLAGRITGANVFTSCNELGIIRTDGQRAYSTPVQLAFELYRNHSGTHTVGCNVDSPPVRGTKEGVKETTLGCLDAVATTAPDGASLFVHVINRSLSETIRAGIRLDGFHPSREGKAWSLSSGSWSDANSFTHPDYVHLKEEAISDLADSFEYVFPPHSAVTLALAKAR